MKRKLCTLLLAVTLTLSGTLGAAAFDGGAVVSAAEKVTAQATSWQTAMSKTATYMTGNLSLTFGNEWTLFGLARSGVLPAGSGTTYYNNLVSTLKAADGVLHARKYTEYSRTILALTALGKDPTAVGGYNLLEKLADFDQVIWQGNNGAIWALIALDSGSYDIPVVKNVKTQTTRDKLVNAILETQLNDGGWTVDRSAAADTASDVDMTAMALQALAPYESRAAVRTAIDKGLTRLSALENSDGTYSSYDTANAESTAQVLVALTALGIDPAGDSRFIKNGKTTIDGLLTFYVSTGGFLHTAAETAANGMATEQAYYALTAYSRFVDGQSRLYAISDSKGNSGASTSGSKVTKPARVTISKLTSARTKTLTVKWKKISGAAGYQIKYSTTGTFKSGKTKTVTASKSATTRTLKGLTKGKTYYVKIRAYKTDGSGNKVYGSYSTVKKVNVK